MKDKGKVIAVTGAAGYVGRLVVGELARDRAGFRKVLALDVREVPAAQQVAGVEHLVADVRSPELGKLFTRHEVDAVVHLASIVAPPPGMGRSEQYGVDVLGTRNVIEACLEAGVGQLVHASSGAAYGYHADNPARLNETDELRGNEAFAYSWHKRLAEEELRRARWEHPELGQLVLRLSTVLGAGLKNQITGLWSGPVVMGVRGTATPFSIIWDRDVARCVAFGLRTGATGIYNLAGSGVVTLRDMAARAGKRFVPIPSLAIKGGIAALRRLGLTHFGPEQVMYVAHRPVLANEALINDLGFKPRLTSSEVFELWLAHEQGKPEPACMRRVRAAEAAEARAAAALAMEGAAQEENAAGAEEQEAPDAGEAADRGTQEEAIHAAQG
jgi:UDP-glucose 4-epimerase